MVEKFDAQFCDELGFSGNFSLDKKFVEITGTKFIKEKSLFFQFGTAFGNFGKFELQNSNNGISSVTPFSPYYVWTNSSPDPFLFLEQYYSLSNVGGKIFGGIGLTFKMIERVSIRFQFNLGYYLVNDKHIHIYKDVYTSSNTAYMFAYSTKHQTISNSLKSLVNYSVSKNIALSIGGEVLFFVPIIDDQYKPESVDFPMVGVESVISLGIIYKFIK